MTKLHTDLAGQPFPYKVIEVSYSIDTSSIPTFVITPQEFLELIQLAGHTRSIMIHEDDNGTTAGGTSIIDKLDEKNSDPSLKDNIRILYAIDNKDGTPIAGGVTTNAV